MQFFTMFKLSLLSFVRLSFVEGFTFRDARGPVSTASLQIRGESRTCGEILQPSLSYSVLNEAIRQYPV